MKYLNKFLMFVVALGITFLSSCSNEEKIGNTPYAEEGNGYLSFVLPLGKGGPVTYATIAADSMENDIKTLRVYWFKSDGKLFKVFAYPSHGASEMAIFDFALNRQNATAVGKIQTGTESGASHFYFVANVNSPAGDGTRSSSLSHVVLNTTTEADFQKFLTDELAEQTDGNLKNIECPLPMSLSKKDHGGLPYIELDPSTTPNATVHLKRRVARFDILNNADYTGFKIKNVIVSNAKNAVFIEDSLDVADNSGKMLINVEATANGTALDPSDDVDDGSLSGSIAGNKIQDVFDAGQKDSLEWNKAQFYLYPTTLTLSNGGSSGNTIISIEGSYNGETRIYTLDLKNATDIDILSNKVYKIRIKRYKENTLTSNFTIEPWDWDDDSISTSRDNRAVKFDHIAFSSADASKIDTINVGDGDDVSKVDTIRYTTAPGQQYAELLLVNTGYTLNGDVSNGNVTSLALQPNYSGFLDEDSLAILNANHQCSFTTVRTYAATGEALQYETTHRIRLPHTKAPIAFDILVQSQTNAQRTKKYYVESWDYNEAGYAPIRVGDLLWAPFNVGATALPAEKKTWSTNDSAARSWTGCYFQWGRNVPFYPDSTPTTIAGPLTLAAASATTAFIKSGTHWLASADYDADLWGGVSNDPVKRQGPCPTGWYIPNLAQGQALCNASAFSYKNWWHSFAVPKQNSTAKDTLYFPLGGSRGGGTGNLENYGGTTPNGYYTFRDEADNTRPKRMYFSSTVFNLTNIGDNQGDNKSKGWMIRPVRDYVLMPYERP